MAVLSDVRLVTWELDEGSWYRTAGTDLEYSMVRSALLTKISLAGPIYGKLGGGVAVESFRLFGSGWVLEDDDAHLGIEVSIEETRYYPMGVAGLGLDIGIGTHVGVYVDGSASWLASNRGDSPVAELDGNRHRYLGPAGMPSRSSSVLDLTAGLRFAL